MIGALKFAAPFQDGIVRMNPTDATRTLALYSSRDGQTRLIVSTIRDRLVEAGLECELRDLHAEEVPAPDDYRAVLIGASIRYGRFDPRLARYAERHREALNARPSAFVAVNLTARKAQKRTPETNAYTRKFLAASPWRPELCEVVAGALRYPRYRLVDRLMIQLIMRMTGGETDASKEVEYTDWAQVEAFAARFSSCIHERLER